MLDMLSVTMEKSKQSRAKSASTTYIFNLGLDIVLSKIEKGTLIIATWNLHNIFDTILTLKDI